MINILILGGGFGGIRTALDLGKKFDSQKDITITLIDRKEYQTFFPSIYEVASVFGINHEHPYHTKLRGTVCISYQDIFDGKRVNLLQAEIARIDLENRKVQTQNGQDFSFDYLVIALGSTFFTYGIPGVLEYAYKFKSIEDALMLNDKIEELFRDAAKQKKSLPIRILVGGAGFTGIELAAELANCTRHVAHRHSITQKLCTQITLIEAGPEILPMVSPQERKIIESRLAKLSITTITNASISEVAPDHVQLKDGRKLGGDLIVWTAGVKAIDLLSNLKDLALDERQRILVNEYLQTNNHKNVFAVGDNIIFIDPKNKKPVPQMAFTAVEQGSVAAENIKILINNKKDDSPRFRTYHPDYDYWIAPVGSKYAVAHLKGITFTGFVGYFIRQLVDLRYLLMILPIGKAIGLFISNMKVFAKND